MSRAYDAKQAALSAYPDDKYKAETLFLGFLGTCEDDFKHEFNQTPQQYLYGE
jgi:hypothetical protein